MFCQRLHDITSFSQNILINKRYMQSMQRAIFDAQVLSGQPTANLSRWTFSSAWPLSGPAFRTILLSQQVFPLSTSLFSGTCGRACAALRPRGIVLPQFHRKLAGNDLSDMRRGRARKGKKTTTKSGPSTEPYTEQIS